MRACLCVLLVFSASSLLAADDHWHWAKAGNNINGWTISEGDAEVEIENGRFIASLFWKGSNNDLQILLKGKLQEGKLRVEETIEESDHTGSIYHGIIQKQRWKDTGGTFGGEAMTLTDGWSIIGITRATPK